MGKIDIDYQVLHDAFFKYQTKPKMTGMGELYYEGKEYEMDLKGKKPGTLTEDVKAALGMTDDGGNAHAVTYSPLESVPGTYATGLLFLLTLQSVLR